MQMNTRPKLSMVTAIHLRWWGMRALSKAHELSDTYNQPGWSTAYQAATIAFKRPLRWRNQIYIQIDCATDIAAQVS